MSNINLQETVKQFMNPSQSKPSIPNLTHRKSRKSLNKSTGTIKPSTPLKASDIKNFFIVRQLDMLEQHVSNYNVYQSMLDSDNEKEIK